LASAVFVMEAKLLETRSAYLDLEMKLMPIISV
jgi:hypothetical protein